MQKLRTTISYNLLLVLGSVGLAPRIARAQCDDSSCATDSLGDLLSFMSSLIRDYLLPILFTVATIAFIWGVIKYFLIQADNDYKQREGRQFMVWGLLAMFVIFAVWGILGVVFNTFGIQPGGTLPVPSFETSG